MTGEELKKAVLEEAAQNGGDNLLAICTILAPYLLVPNFTTAGPEDAVKAVSDLQTHDVSEEAPPEGEAAPVEQPA